MAASPRAMPVRTCVGCRSTAPRADLVRLVADPPATCAVVVDATASAPGRGAWLHPHPGCLRAALARRAVSRALRIAGPVDTSAVETWFTTSVVDQESGLEADGHPMSSQR